MRISVPFCAAWWPLLLIACSSASDEHAAVPRAGPSRADAGSPRADAGSPRADAGVGCGAGCDPTFFSTCCDGACVNAFNDPHNCGSCGKRCPAAAPLCSNGICVVPACGDPVFADAAPTCTGAELCCGAECCKGSEICCHMDRYAPTVGLMLGCFDPSKFGGTCPVGCRGCSCAAPDTPVATAGGERAIATLAVGDLVYTVHHDQIVLAPLLEVHRTSVSHHHVVRVRFSDGTSLDVSAPHPTADGRHFGDLRSGDDLGGRIVVGVRRVPYEFESTYDILPDSDTGTYFANGALIGSTLGGSANDAARALVTSAQ